MTDNDKVFHTFEELVDRLASRGVAVDEHTRTVLMRESYYAVVNGYKDLFLDAEASNLAGEDRYRPGTAFDEVYRLHLLDRSLRSTLLPVLLVAETTLKTLIVHTFCEHFQERDSYLNKDNYDLRSQREYAVTDVIENLTRALEVKSGRHKKDFIDHYLSKHEHVPLWVLANFLTFGAVSKFFDALRESTQASACKAFWVYSKEVRDDGGVRIEPFGMKNMLRRLSDFRNICAHEERLYCVGLGPVCDVRVKQLVVDLELVLPPDTYEALAADLVEIVDDAATGFTTISIEDVLAEMGFASLDDFKSIVPAEAPDPEPAE